MAKKRLESFQADILICNNCDSTVTQPATLYCQTCEELLCQDCKELHNNWKNNADHIVINIDSDTSEIKQRCKNYSEYRQPGVCRNCKRNSCSGFCVKECHEAGHDAIDIKEEKEVKDDIEKLLEEAGEKIKTVLEHAEYVDEQKEKVKEAVGACRDDIEKAHEEALARLEAKRIARLEACERQEAAMLDSLDEAVDRDNELMSSLTSACSMTWKGVKDSSRKGRGVWPVPALWQGKIKAWRTRLGRGEGSDQCLHYGRERREGHV